MDVDAAVEEILGACRSMAGLPYDGEPVDQLAHALQAAALAEAEHADDELLVAALLHDIARAPAVAGIMRDAPDHHHGELGSAWLTPRVGARVAWLAEQHVAAKRYLVAVDGGYRAGLSPTSVKTLVDQGGPMSEPEVAAVEADPDWAHAVRLRRWDDLAKDPEADVPGLEHYREPLRSLVARHADATSSRAVAFDGPGRPLRLVTVPLPPLTDRELLVRVTATTLCGSDLSSFAGRRPVATPTVLGHESIGIVEAAGAGVRDVEGAPVTPGSRISWTITAGCGACSRCRAGIPQKCTELVKYGHEPLGRARGPAGGLAERVLLPPGTGVVVLPDDLSDRIAAPASCATATVAGALRVGGVGPEDTVVVTGLGMLGLTACAMAATAGATVIGVDVAAERIQLARRFGATMALDAAAAVHQIDGATVVLELSGSPQTTAAALRWLEIGGRMVLVGAVHPGDPVQLDAELVVRHLLRIDGLHNYTPADLQTAVEFLRDHGEAWPFAELVVGDYGLDAVQAAFTAAQGGAHRVLVRP